MKFEAITLNWLALHGNFDGIDMTIFPDYKSTGLSKLDFLYRLAGFKGIKDRNVAPSDQLDVMSDFLTGCSITSESSADLSALAKSIGLSKKDYGVLKSFEGVTGTDIHSIVYSKMLQYFLNPNNQILTVYYADGNSESETIFDYIHNSFATGKEVSVDMLLKLKLVDYEVVKRTTQFYIVGTTVYSYLTKERFDTILSEVYETVIKICSKELISSLGTIVSAFLNIYNDTEKEKVKSIIRKYIVYSGCLGLTLNQLMNLFGYNIPDLLYSLQQFGKPTVVNFDNMFIQSENDGTLTSFSSMNVPQRLSGDTIIEIDSDEVNEIVQESCGPRRMTL